MLRALSRIRIEWCNAGIGGALSALRRYSLAGGVCANKLISIKLPSRTRGFASPISAKAGKLCAEDGYATAPGFDPNVTFGNAHTTPCTRTGKRPRWRTW